MLPTPNVGDGVIVGEGVWVGMCVAVAVGCSVFVSVGVRVDACVAVAMGLGVWVSVGGDVSVRTRILFTGVSTTATSAAVGVDDASALSPSTEWRKLINNTYAARGRPL